MKRIDLTTFFCHRWQLFGRFFVVVGTYSVIVSVCVCNVHTVNHHVSLSFAPKKIQLNDNSAFERHSSPKCFTFLLHVNLMIAFQQRSGSLSAITHFLPLDPIFLTFAPLANSMTKKQHSTNRETICNRNNTKIRVDFRRSVFG